MTTMSTGAGVVWSIVIPVKRLDRAKSRLEVREALRANLALAMASDTARAAMAATAVGEVVVVTDDVRAARALRAIGARVVSDQPNAGLNPALRHGMHQALYDAVGFLSSDLPALRPADLGSVLNAAASRDHAVVADIEGTGTTLLTTRRGTAVTPRFGPGSFAAHLAAGAADLTSLAAMGLRQDVDTLGGLDRALRLGAGTQTLRQAGVVPTADG